MYKCVCVCMRQQKKYRHAHRNKITKSYFQNQSFSRRRLSLDIIHTSENEKKKRMSIIIINYVNNNNRRDKEKRRNFLLPHELPSLATHTFDRTKLRRVSTQCHNKLMEEKGNKTILINAQSNKSLTINPIH